MRPQAMRRVPHRLNLLWLREKLASPEEWSIRDRDDIVFFIEQKRRQLERTSKHHEPLRSGREEFLAELEVAMETHIRSQQPADEVD
jgi:hypothetical protein